MSEDNEKGTIMKHLYLSGVGKCEKQKNRSGEREKKTGNKMKWGKKTSENGKWSKWLTIEHLD